MKYMTLVLVSAACVYADPESAKKYLNGHELIRVATKYPNIAKGLFLQQKTPDCGDY